VRQLRTMTPAEERTARSVNDGLVRDRLGADMERYRLLAVELGAADSKIVSTHDIVIDERVRGKCRYPTCPSYNTNMNCPPYTMSVDEFRTLQGRYDYAILFKVDAFSGDLAEFERVTNKVVMNIVWRLESAAFYDGNYLATGFGGTNCKEIFCRNVGCAAISGQGCRHPFKARPSMHGMGIDAFRMAVAAGWELSAKGNEVPRMVSMGLVLVD